MPFENATHEPRFNWLAEGCAAALTDELSALGAQALSRDDRLRALEHLRIPPTATLSEATIIRIAQIVAADQVLVGSFAVNGSTLTSSRHAAAARHRTSLPGNRGERPLNDFFALFGNIARLLLPDATASLRTWNAFHPPLAAFEQLIKGSVAESPATQIVFLKEALRYSPGISAPAWRCGRCIPGKAITGRRSRLHGRCP
jgi:TolB-like protein